MVSIGKDRSGLFAPGVAEYHSRLAHWATVSLKELPESRASGARAKEEEAAALLAQVGPKDALVALDERGKEFTSAEFSAWVVKQQDQARDLVFVIGGDEGLNDAVRARAAVTLSLSRLTLPHRMARLVLIEQIYRAFTLIKGLPYHK